MEQRNASRSAAVVAAHRAAEWLKPEEERICHDPYAGQLIPEKTTVIGQFDIPHAQAMAIFRQLVPGFHEFFLARTRHIDDLLEQALAEGVGQVVILGAGYDSRAHRIPGLKGERPVFEVDHPATQAVKRERLAQIPELNPEHARYVPADLALQNREFQNQEFQNREFQNREFQTRVPQESESRDLETRLMAQGFDPEKSTFFIWEGVTMYLAPEAVEGTLGMISRLSVPGSTLVFDITRPEVILGRDPRPEAIAWLATARKNEEPLQFGISRDEVGRMLETLGFTGITVSGSWDFKAAYFSRPGDDRESTPILSIVTARKA